MSSHLKPYYCDNLDQFPVSSDDDELFDDLIFDSPTMRRSNVKFSDIVSIEETINVRNMDISEINNTWYSRNDLDAIRREYRKLVNKLIKSEGMKTPTHHICVRGLEEKINQMPKKMNRREAVNAVLHEQEAQWDDGRSNVEALAQVYHKFSTLSVDEAVELARQDEEDALAIHAAVSSSPSYSVSTKLKDTSKATTLVAES